MKKSLLVSLALILSAGNAMADTCSKGFTGLFTSFQAAKICSTFGAGFIGTLANNTFVVARNAANSANINVWKVDATDDTVLNGDTGDVIKLSIAGTPEVVVDNDLMQFQANGVVAGPTSLAIGIGPTAVTEVTFSDDKMAFSGNAGVISAPTSVGVAVGAVTEATFANDKLTFSGNAAVITAATSVAVSVASTPIVVASGSGTADVLACGAVASGTCSLTTSSVDAADTNTMIISSTGCATGDCTSRGAYSQWAGNETSGNMSNVLGGATGVFSIVGNSGGTNLYRVTDTGASGPRVSWNAVRSTPAATPVEGTNDAKSLFNFVGTAAANDAVGLPSVPQAGEVHIVFNVGPNSVRLKAYGTPGIGAGAAGTYIPLATFQGALCASHGAGLPWDCGTMTVPTPAGP